MKEKGFQRGIAASLDMPLELGSGAVKITVVDGSSVLVENHGGIRRFTSTEIVVGTEEKELVIRGAGLSLTLLKKDEIEAEGDIFGVYYKKDGGK